MLNIEQLRKEKGISVTGFAKELGISRQHVYHLQNGDRVPNVELGLKLSLLLEVCPFELFNVKK